MPWIFFFGTRENVFFKSSPQHISIGEGEREREREINMDQFHTTVVPSIFGIRDQFCGRQFFHRLWWGDCLGTIQVHYIPTHFLLCSPNRTGPVLVCSLEVGDYWHIGCTLTGDRTHNLGMYPDLESNP